MRILIIYLLMLCEVVCAQLPVNYRYDSDLLPAAFHKGRRDALRAAMPENSAAVIFAAPERLYSNDNDYQYHQSPNFYYLTGFTEPNALLVIFKTPQTVNGIITDEMLFVPERNADRESWTGIRAGREGAGEISGIVHVFNAASFDSMFIDFSVFDKLWYQLPKGAIDSKMDNEDIFSLTETFRKKAAFPPANGDAGGFASAMAALREIKQPEEIALIRKAAAISCEGHNEIMRCLAPGMHEYDAQAIGEYVWKRLGSEYVGYPSICGGGENSCILHYENNRKELLEGEIIVNDMAAEYHGYSADVTRTLPVNGKFSPAQKAIYELVFRAQQAGIEACKAGNDFNAAHKAAVEVIRKGLLDLEIIKSESDYKKYFFHSTSHYLGLDVHDAGTYDKLKPGVVLTVEPGIYIPEGSPCDPKWWKTGVRIEDDILVTEKGPENLSAACPSTVEAIEALMKEKPHWLKEK